VTPPQPFTAEPSVVATPPAQETGPVAQAEPTKTADQGQRDERLRVLELLEKGEIDIEDALARLEATKDDQAT
jgi:hypothetical protein